MPKRILRKIMPNPQTIKNHKFIRLFGSLLNKNNLWSCNRHSISGAVAVGLFCAFIPLPFQMVIAAGLAILCQVHIPMAVVLVWITNPVTIPPMFFSAYLVGNWILDTQEQKFYFEPTLEWFQSALGSILEPFLLGCFVCGVVSATIGFFSIRLLWRLIVIYRLRQRKMKFAQSHEIN